MSTQPLTWGSSLLLAVLVPRYLSDHGLGQYAMAERITEMLRVAASLGAPDNLTRRVARQPGQIRENVTATLVVSMTAAFIVAAVLFAAAPWVQFGIDDEAVLRLALVGMVIATAQSVLASTMMGQEHHGRYAWLNASGVVLGAVGGVAALAAGAGIIGYMGASITAWALVTVLGWWRSGLTLRLASVNTAALGQVVRGGLPFLGWNLAIRIRAQIDVVLVGALLETQAAGWLAAAYRIISIPVFIPTLITTPLLPALSRSVGDRALFEHTVRRSSVAVLILTIPTSAVILALAPMVPSLLGWGAEFQHAVPLMMVLSFQQPLVALDMVLGAALVALGNERRWLRVAVTAAVFNPAANLVLIPAFEGWLGQGVLSAVFVELATELVMLTGALILLPKGLVERRTRVTWLCVVAAGGLQILVTVAIGSASVGLAIAVGGAVYIAALLALGVLRPADLRSMRQTALKTFSRNRAGTVR